MQKSKQAAMVILLIGGLAAALLPNYGFSQSQSGCAKDNLGRVVCAPAGGIAVKSFDGVVCAPGSCVTDNLGYLKCSTQKGGGASRDNLGRPVCVGGCTSPSRDYCSD
jgi:hypothetical protein